MKQFYLYIFILISGFCNAQESDTISKSNLQTSVSLQLGKFLDTNDYLKKLIGKLNKPLVSTSANFSGYPSPMKFADISQEIISSVDAVAEENHDKISQYSGSSVIRMWKDGRVKVLRE